MPHTCPWCKEWRYWLRVPGCATRGCKWYDWYAEKLHNRMLQVRAASVPVDEDAWAEEEAPEEAPEPKQPQTPEEAPEPKQPQKGLQKDKPVPVLQNAPLDGNDEAKGGEPIGAKKRKKKALGDDGSKLQKVGTAAKGRSKGMTAR